MGEAENSSRRAGSDKESVLPHGFGPESASESAEHLYRSGCALDRGISASSGDVLVPGTPGSSANPGGAPEIPEQPAVDTHKYPKPLSARPLPGRSYDAHSC